MIIINIMVMRNTRLSHPLWNQQELLINLFCKALTGVQKLQKNSTCAALHWDGDAMD